jgi:TRAP-type C4-dicarboxylate transport system permease small subunit
MAGTSPAMTRNDGTCPMSIADKLVLKRQRHLKWRALDRLELILMMLCGLLCFGFSMSVTADIVTRTIGHPWLWLQEVTSTLFIYAIFIGAAVATRRNDHLYLTAISESMHGASRLIVEIVLRVVVLSVAVCLIWYGYLNYLRGFGSFRLPSGTPIASLYAIIPLSGVLIALFTVEQLVNGIVNGFDHPEPQEDELVIPAVDTGSVGGKVQP